MHHRKLLFDIPRHYGFRNLIAFGFVKTWNDDHIVRDHALVNGWSRVIVSQNGGLTDYIFPFRLRVLQ